MSQSAAQKPSLKPQTASNAGVEANKVMKSSKLTKIIIDNQYQTTINSIETDHKHPVSIYSMYGVRLHVSVFSKQNETFAGYYN